MNDKRNDGRIEDALRPISIERNISLHAEGSAYIKVGRTEVLCAATVEERVPPFLKNSGKGWVTAEYAMLPRATSERVRRERKGAGGRTMEIQRLIGRSLRAVVDLPRLGERSVTIDCDVIQADGGTRTASITGACVAMYDAMSKLVEDEMIATMPIRELVAATSVGMFEGAPILDLNYEEDSAAEVDMNVVMTESGLLVEVQGTAEEEPYSRETLNTLMDFADKGCTEIFALQRGVLGLSKEAGAKA